MIAMHKEFEKNDNFTSDAWTLEDYQRYEPIPAWEFVDTFQFNNLNIPEEFSNFCIKLNEYEEILLRDNWEWMKHAPYTEDFSNENSEENNLYLVSIGEAEPVTPCEFLWLKVQRIRDKWRQLEAKCKWAEESRIDAIKYIEELEGITESYLNSTLATVVQNMMKNISFLSARHMHMEQKIKQLESWHQDEIEQISDILRIRGLRLTEKINGRYTIFDRIKL